MFSGRFLLLVCANLITLLGKQNIFSALPAAVELDALKRNGTEDSLVNINMNYIFFLSALAVLLPGLITALVSTWHSKMLKTFLNHPSFFILPIFTCFTFSSSKKTCCTRDGGAEGHIRFSVNASFCNLFTSFLVSVVLVTIYDLAFLTRALNMKNLLYLFVGLLLSLLFLCNVRLTNARFNCCCCCCSCCSCKAAIEYGIYKPDQPTKQFRIDADGSEVVLPADYQEKQADEENALKEQEQEQDRKQETGEEESEELVDEEPGQEKEQGTEEEQEEEQEEEEVAS